MKNYLHFCLFVFSLSTRNSNNFFYTTCELQVAVYKLKHLNFDAIQSSVVSRLGFGVLNALLQIEASTRECKCLQINFESLSLRYCDGLISTFQAGSIQITICKPID